MDLTETFEKLAAAGIQLVPAEIDSHFIFERDGFVAFVERRSDTAGHSFGSIGAPGLMTERGFAALIWRGGQAFFVAKGFEAQASTEEIDKIRKFSADLASALGH